MRREMEYVYGVYKEGSFSKAAKKLFVSQPALSSTIKKLEQELNTPLFDRSCNPIQVTEAGRIYVNTIEEIIEIEKRLDRYFDELHSMKTGSLTIAAGSFFCSYSLPLHLKPFLEQYPNITVTFMEDHAHDEMSRLLKSGQIDFVLTSTSEPYKNYSRQFFSQEQLIIAVPQKYITKDSLKEYQYSFRDVIKGRHTMPDSPTVSLREFKDIPFISLNRDSELYQRTQLLFQNVDISPRITMYLDQILTAYYMVWHGYGFSIIRDSTLNIVPLPADNGNNVVFYKIDDPLTMRNIYFYHKPSEYLSIAARMFIEYTKESCIPLPF